MSDAAPRITLFAHEDALTCLEGREASGSPFQSAGWLKGWLETCGTLEAFRVARFERQGGCWLLPVVLEKKAGLVLARKPGAKHASYFSLLSEGAPAPLDQRDFAAIARALGADAVLLEDCPETWSDMRLLAPGFPLSPSAAQGLTIPGTIEAVYTGEARKKLRYKARKLAELGEITHGFAEGAAAQAALEAILDWKAAQFGALGIKDPFSDKKTQDFLQQGLASGGPLRVFALHLNGKAIAALVLAEAGGHFSGMVNGYEPAGEVARYGPGDTLLYRLVETLVAAGARGLDLGVGEARYKRLHCPEVIALVDVVVAASLRGAPLARAYALARHAKRALKQHDGAFGALKAWRGHLFSRS